MMRSTTTKSELEVTVAELETRLENVASASNSNATRTTGQALGRLRWRVVEQLELPNEARTTILAEIDSMIDNL
jgi:hypothetical protein